jgi:hypothetical protein
MIDKRSAGPEELYPSQPHFAVAATEKLVAVDTQQHMYDLVKHHNTALVITYGTDGASVVQ